MWAVWEGTEPTGAGGPNKQGLAPMVAQHYEGPQHNKANGAPIGPGKVGGTGYPSMQGPPYRPTSGGVGLGKFVVCGHEAPGKLRPLYGCRWYALACLPLPAYPRRRLRAARRAKSCPAGLGLPG